MQPIKFNLMGLTIRTFQYKYTFIYELHLIISTKSNPIQLYLHMKFIVSPSPCIAGNSTCPLGLERFCSVRTDRIGYDYFPDVSNPSAAGLNFGLSPNWFTGPMHSIGDLSVTARNDSSRFYLLMPSQKKPNSISGLVRESK